MVEDEAAAVGLPMSVGALIEYGGVDRLEREAAARVVRETRQFWLPILEAWLDHAAASADADWSVLAYLAGEITRLRRATGIPASPERRRAQVRDRVRRWRQKQRSGDV
jgi:hypothetical protein